MSDFLKGFTKDSYNQPKRTSAEQISGEPVMQTRQANPVEQRVYANPTISENAREEIYVKDPGSGKRRRKRLAVITGGSLIFCLILGFLIYTSRTVTIPDFVGGYADRAEVWAAQNSIFIDAEEEYSIEHSRGVVISQLPAAPGRMFRGNFIEIIVSMGADQQQYLPLPDFTAMELSAIEEWIRENMAENATITREFSDTVPVNQFIRREFRTLSVTDETYRRADRMVIFVSSGPQRFERNITVPDFNNRTEAEVVQWASGQDVRLTIERAYSETILSGLAISQSINPDTLIAQDEEITVIVSRGRAIYAPSFAGLTKEEASIKAASAGIILSFIDQYHESVRPGAFISQSIAAGTIMEGGKNTIIAYYSIGRPFIPDFAGQKENVAVQILADMNNKNADLDYKLEYINDNETPRGSVIFNTNANSTVSVGSDITLTVSKGARVTIGSYVGNNISSTDMQTKIAVLRARGLRITARPVTSTREPGTVIRQSIAPNTQLDAADNLLILEVADYEGRAGVLSLVGLTKGEASRKAASDGMALTFVDQYHDTIGAGSYITHSVNGNSVVAYYSLGRPFIPDFAGQNENQVVQTFTDMNNRNADLTYVLEYVNDNDTPNGIVIFNTNANSTVPVGSDVTVTISRGARITIGSYVGKFYHFPEMQSIIARFRDQGLRISIRHVTSAHEADNTIIGQSIAPNTQLDAADNLLILEVAR